MPFFDIETDQGVFTIDADREPTPQEVQDLYASGQLEAAPPVIQRDLSVVSPEFRQQYLAEAEKPVAQRLFDVGVQQARLPVDLVTGIAKQLVNAGIGGLQAPAAMLGTEVARIEQNPLEIFSAPRRLAGQALQSGFEAVVRTPTDIIRSIPDLARLSPGAAVVQALTPRDTSEAAIEAAALKALQDQEFEKIRAEGLAPQIFGQPQVPELTEAIQTFAPVPAVGPARIAAGARGGVQAARQVAGVPGQALRGIRDAAARTVSQSPALSPIVRGLESRGLRASYENLGADVFNVPRTGPRAEKYISAVDSGGFVEELDEIRKVKTPTNYPELISAGETTVSNLGGEIGGFIKTQGATPVNNASAGAAGRGVVSPLDVRDYPEAAANIETRAALFDQPMTLERTFDELKQINDRVGSYYRKSEAGQATYLDDLENAADLAMRDQLSANADNLFRGLTGIDRNPFRLYGRVNERVSQARAHYNQLRIGTGQQVARGAPAATTITEGVARGLRRARQVVTGGDLDTANANVRKLFQRAPKGPPPVSLTPEEVQKMTAPLTAIPPPIPGSAPAALDLEQAIALALERGAVPSSPGGIAGIPLSVPQLQGLAGGSVPIPTPISSELARVIEASRLANERARQLQLLQQSQGGVLSFPD